MTDIARLMVGVGYAEALTDPCLDAIMAHIGQGHRYRIQQAIIYLGAPAAALKIV